MKTTCCRSCPRCSDCPVLLLAAARRRRDADPTAELVTEIFAGRPLRTLPKSVADALESLRPVRAPRRFEPSSRAAEGAEVR